VPPNTPLFLLGLALGIGLLVAGILLGFFLGRRAGVARQSADREHFLQFLHNLALWTSEFAGDVSKYQLQLRSLSEQVQIGSGAPREQILGLLTQIMQANQQLQQRLDSAEQRLESQTNQIADYLTEARTDGLTGLANRRALDQVLNDLYANWQAKHQAFTLGLIDIDHFKKINDDYGHPVGDMVLRNVAEVIRTEFSDAVSVARYGGEEFAVLWLIDATEAAARLDRLRETIAGMRFTYEQIAIPVTMSAGVSQVLVDDRIGNVVRRSDEALYAAKLGGRNRVVWHDGTQCHLISQEVEAAAGLDTPCAPSPLEADAERRARARLAQIVEQESDT